MEKTPTQLAEDISEIHGALAAHDALVFSLVQVLTPAQLQQLSEKLHAEVEAAHAALLNTKANDRLLASLTDQANRHSRRLAGMLAAS